MNKLVSRNPVLRFKGGRKIEKMLFGGFKKLLRKIEKVWDTPIQVLLTPGTAGSYAAFGYNMPKTQSTIGDLANLLAATVTAPAIMGTAGKLAAGKAASNANKIVLTGLKLISGATQRALPGKVSTSNVPAVIGKQVGFSTPLNALTTGLKIWRGIGGTTLLAFPFLSSMTNSGNPPLDNNTLNPPDYSWMKGGTRLRTPEELKKWEAEVLRLKNLQNTIKAKKNTPPSTLVTQKKNWEDEFKNNFTNTLTNAQRQYLDSKGINYTDAAAVLEFLMNLLQTDLGGYKNDGKWGKNSILAWKDFAANNIPENFDVQRNQETMTVGNEPYVEQPITPAPTLGYRTYNTYEGNDFSNRLKSMGIKSNADLINFMHKTNGENYNWNGDSWARLFRSDVNRALGGDYSDANIRKTFNTSGNWGNGFLGRGDIGDFQNALQINAGTWNGIYDNKLQNLVKNIDWSKFKYFKQGGNMLPSRNIIERFKQGRKIELFLLGGIKRFRLSSTDGKVKKEFDTEAEAIAYRKKNNIVGRITDLANSARGLVVKTDRTTGKDARATAYGRLLAEKNNNLSFKQAYQAARKEGNKYFAYKGKVYKSDLLNGKDNITDMQMLYGTHLGYSKDPKLLNTSSRVARELYRKDTKAVNTNRNANYHGKTNKQVSAEADKKVALTWNEKQFMDLMLPTPANMINYGIDIVTGNIPNKPHVSGLNVPGLFTDAVEGNYKDAGYRALDLGLSFAPGARVNMVPGGTNVTKGATLLPNGTRTFSKWQLNSLGKNATRPMEGVLRSPKGTLYYIDNGQFTRDITAPLLISNVPVQRTYDLEK